VFIGEAKPVFRYWIEKEENMEKKSMHRIIMPFTLCNKDFYMRFRANDNEERIHLTQNLQANEDLWRIGFDLDRWRAKEELVSLLRDIADAVERVELSAKEKECY
jgi:hypothetical protein